MTCSEGQNGEFNLDFKVLVKTGGFNVWKLKVKQNKIKFKRSLLEVSGYWIWVLKVIEGFSGPFSSLWRG